MTEDEAKDLSVTFVSGSQAYKQDQGSNLQEIKTFELPCEACWDMSYEYQSQGVVKDIVISIRGGRIDYVQGWNGGKVGIIEETQASPMNEAQDVYIDGDTGIVPGSDIAEVKRKVEEYIQASETFLASNGDYLQIIQTTSVACEGCWNLSYEYSVLAENGKILGKKNGMVSVRNWVIVGMEN